MSYATSNPNWVAKLKKWLDFGSIRFRLTALYVSFFGATLIIFSSILYNALIRTHQRDFDIDLYNYTVDAAQGINLDLAGAVTITEDALASGGKIIPFTLGNSFLQILDQEGNLIARSRTLGGGKLPLTGDDWNHLLNHKVSLRTITTRDIFQRSEPNKSHRPNLIDDRNDSPEMTFPATNDNHSYRLISYLVANRFGKSFILQVAAPTTLLDQAAQGLGNFLLFGIPITLVISTFAGYYFAGQALNPVKAIINKSRQLSPRNLSERIPLPHAEDELRKLALTLNELLDRLQQAFESQERFIADASHELKTPLAILRGELDLMRSRPRTEAEFSEFTQSASQELEHLSSVVEDLLLLARVDAGTAMLSLKPVRLDEAALEVISRMERLARRKEVKLRFELQNSDSPANSDFEFQGDSDLLKVMMKNLIENAVKFSPPHSTVEIRLADFGTRIHFSVKDQGPGVPEHLQGKIFDRFFRISSTSSTPGAGLGLAIARRIAQAHHGSLEVESRLGQDSQTGATFHIHLVRTD